MNTTAKPAVVLLSGGLDSATVLAIAKSAGYACYALSFDYGQRHRWELECAGRIAASLGAAEHRIARIDLRAFGGSALTADIEVPRLRTFDEMSREIPVTYVPARNTIFHYCPAIALELAHKSWEGNGIGAVLVVFDMNFRGRI